MLDHEIKQAYKNIAPSSELKQKILAMKAPPQSRELARRRLLKPIVSLAACLVLLLGSVSIISYQRQLGQTDIVLQDGTVLTGDAIRIIPETVGQVAAISPRVASADPVAYDLAPEEVAIELHISSRKEVFLEVNEGIMYAVSDEDDLVVDLGQQVSESPHNGEIRIRWVIPSNDADAEYEMAVGKNEIIRVTYRAQTDEYLIVRENAENK